MIDQKEPTLDFKNKENNDINKNYSKNINYLKKLLRLLKKKLKDIMKYLKKNLKKIFLIEFFIIKFSKSIFLSNLILENQNYVINSKKDFSKSG